jgi:hypothetical protein
MNCDICQIKHSIKIQNENNSLKLISFKGKFKNLI